MEKFYKNYIYLYFTTEANHNYSEQYKLGKGLP